MPPYFYPSNGRPLTLPVRAQVIALVSYVAAYFPGGIQTLRFGGQMALRGAGSLLPF